MRSDAGDDLLRGGDLTLLIALQIGPDDGEGASLPMAAELNRKPFGWIAAIKINSVNATGQGHPAATNLIVGIVSALVVKTANMRNQGFLPELCRIKSQLNRIIPAGLPGVGPAGR